MESMIPKYENIELLLVTLWVTFLKENQVGQSVYTEYVEETKCPIDQTGPLPDFEFDAISNKNMKLQKLLLEHFGRDGEQVYERIQFTILLYAIQIVTEEF